MKWMFVIATLTVLTLNGTASALSPAAQTYSDLQYDAELDIVMAICDKNSMATDRLYDFVTTVSHGCVRFGEGYSAHIRIHNDAEQMDAEYLATNTPTDYFYFCDPLTPQCFGGFFP